MRRMATKTALIMVTVTAVVTTAALLTIGATDIRTEARTGIQTGVQAAGLKRYDSSNLIRFHVIANSDSERDQALKRRVRNAVVRHMTPEFAKAANLAEARLIAASHLEEIKAVAQSEVNTQGENFPVRAVLGKFSFPVRSYGNLTLPAGEHEAVRIVIGKGQGANWWCVLFPPLCFVDVSKEAKIKADSSSSVSLTPDEEIKVKFKILELLGW